MQIPLTHRFLPKRFEDLQPETVPILKSFLEADAFHLLITGGSNTGKTATCGVMLKEYYGDATDNIMILGGLKEQGMTFYRNEVRCFCQTTSTGKKKTLVVNDVDEFPEQAQQVFMNYLDHYRERVNFIMTARYETAVVQPLHSRLVRLHLNPMSEEFIASVVQKANADLPEEVVRLIAKRSLNSVTAAINCVEKMDLAGDAGIEGVEKVFCLIDPPKLGRFVEMVEGGDKLGATKYLCDFLENGFSVIDVLDAMTSYLKGAALADARKYRYVEVICQYTAIFILVHEHPLELAFFVNDLCGSGRT